jgi:serine/threonine protein kinase/class 3 adenylate cyclase
MHSIRCKHMTTPQTESLLLETAHVLFLDIVGFSKLPINEEREIIRELQQTVSDSFEFVRAQKRTQLISLPTGDGMALVFFGDTESPVKCALEISRAIHGRTSSLKLRMGVHTGPVYRIADINSNRNVAGGGINTAQRVMDCGDAGHILLSGTAAEMLSQVDRWNSKMHDLGEVEVKHGQIVRLFNLYGPEFGNPEIPEKVKGKRKTKDSPREPPALSDDEMIGQQFSHYKILKQLGKGGMGVVYQAQDQRLGRLVALKFLPESHSSNKSALDRFLQEARTAATLNHPNICTVHDIGSYRRQNFIVMELLQGESLKHVIGEKRLTAEEIVRYCVQIADGLECAHSAGIIHRDIKPGNIFLTPRGQIKVLDFGLARPVKRYAARAGDDVQEASTTEDSNLTGPGELVGTVPYMSPEQACARPLDCRTDLFSFGVVLYEMATGTQPFRGETSAVVFEAILNRAPVSPVRLNPDLPQGLERVINKALEKDPAARYQSAAEMRIDLQQCLTPRTPLSVVESDSAKKQASNVAILYKRNAPLDEQVLSLLESELRKQGYRIFVDRHMQVGMEWAQEIDRRVSGADAVIVLLSAAAANSEMLAYELQIAQESARKRGKPFILPVRINFDAALPGSLANLEALQYSHWRSAEDNRLLVSAILTSLKSPPVPIGDSLKIEAVGGAVPLDSRFYVVRPSDDELFEAIGRKDSVILLKGARQMGKTSLMARGLQEARRNGFKIVLTDFQKLNSSHLESVEKLFVALAGSIADQLDLDINPADCWNPRRGPSMNFERFIKREVLTPLPTSLIWGMDEIDRLFSCDFGSEVFGLFRSWHNERSLDPDGPFKKLTLAIAYATEAHMFIKDMNQSPFNVGTLLVLTDFTPAQLAELNKRYGCPLKDQSEINQFYDLVRGQPYLTRRGLNELASRKCKFSDLASRAADDEGPFGDHLRRLLVSLAEDAALQDAIKGMFAGKHNASQDIFYRLRSSGLVAGESARDMKPRCKLYEDYLARHAL